MDVAQDLPESVAFLYAHKKGLQVGPAAILPVFLRKSQELEPVQQGSEANIS